MDTGFDNRDRSAGQDGGEPPDESREGHELSTVIDAESERSEVSATGTYIDQERFDEAASRAQPLGELAAGSKLFDRFKVLKTIRPHAYNRSGLYKVQDAQGQTLLIKVHRLDSKPYLESLELIAGLEHPNIIKIHEVGEQAELIYEVQEYCEYGSLAQLIPPRHQGITPAQTERILSDVLPQVYAALEFIHRHRLVHRDVKPGNFYIASHVETAEGSRDRLVLGDFDSSRILPPGERSLTVAPGGLTPLYIAPERIARVIGTRAIAEVALSSDYYSLGIMLLELLAGTTTLHLLTSGCFLDPANPTPEENDLLEKMVADFYLDTRQVLAIPEALPEKVVNLLRGLLIRRWEFRWSDEQVGRWLSSATSREDLQLIADHSDHAIRDKQGYKLGNYEVRSLEQLAQAIPQHPEETLKRLKTGGSLIDWIAREDANVESLVLEDMQRHADPPNLLLQCLISRCDPSAPYCFANGDTAITTEEWLQRAEELAGSQEPGARKVKTDSTLQQLAAWLERKSPAEPGLADSIRQILRSPKETRWRELTYLLDQGRPLAITADHHVDDLRQFVDIAYGRPRDWSKKIPANYHAAMECWRSGALEAWMRQRGQAPLARESADLRQTLNNEAGFEKLLRAIRPELAKVKVVFAANTVPRRKSVPYGEARDYQMAYRTEGPGVPFGLLKLVKSVPGTVLGGGGSEAMITARAGKCPLSFYASDLPGSGLYRGKFTLDSDVAEIKGGPVAFRFFVAYPHQLTLVRVLLGMLFGMLLFGLPRLILSFLGEGRLFTLERIDIVKIWQDVVGFHFTTIHLLMCFIVVFVFAFLVYRAWLKALSDSEP